MDKERNYISLEGFQSIYPEEWAKRRKVCETVEGTLESFGFRGISPPSIERRDLYEVKPPWSEGLIGQTFSFVDKRNNRLTLIPEQTPTRARMVQELEEVALPIRWFNTSKRWRQEDVIKQDRAREFWQTDADVIGCGSVETDAEVLACVASIYRNLGLYGEVEILIGERKILENILDCAGVDKRDYYTAVKIVDDIEKIDKQEFIQRFQKLGLDMGKIESIIEAISVKGAFDEGIAQIGKTNGRIADKSLQILERLKRLSALLRWYGIYDICRLDLSVARGSFYTGIIFEVSDKEKKFGALSGGGRYDWLVGMYGKRDLPAIGFGFGHSGTIEMLKQCGLFDYKDQHRCFHVSCEEPAVDYAAAIELVGSLRKNGHRAVIDTGGGCHGHGHPTHRIILKKDFSPKHQVEVVCQDRSTLVVIDDLDSFSKKLN